MALSLTITQGALGNASAGQTMNYVVAITNTGPSAVTLNSLSVSEVTESDSMISQPVFYTPNVAPGVGNPILAANTTTYFPFQAVFGGPVSAASSPQGSVGSGASGLSVQAGFPPDPNFIMLATAQTSDGSVFSSSAMVPVLSSIAPYPLAQGGALHLSEGANFVNLLTSFA